MKENKPFFENIIPTEQKTKLKENINNINRKRLIEISNNQKQLSKDISDWAKRNKLNG